MLERDVDVLSHDTHRQGDDHRCREGRNAKERNQ